MRAPLFTADTHLFHQRILELTKRPYASVEEHDEMIIQNWNKKVGPDDEVFHLGDLVMGLIAYSLPLVGRLNGKIFLVPGNHDRCGLGYSHNPKKYDEQIARWTAEYSKYVTIMSANCKVECWTLPGGEKVQLAHLPYHDEDHAPRNAYESMLLARCRPIDNGLPLIHGHIHETRREQDNMMNVGVDVWDYSPVHYDELRPWLRSVC